MAHTKRKNSTKSQKKNSRKKTLNKVMRGDVKKFKVYVKNGKSIKKVEFGARGMRIKKHNASRRKSFLARHRCSSPGPKTSAKFWSCKMWKV